jgi:hypothetical protein
MWIMREKEIERYIKRRGLRKRDIEREKKRE